MFCSRKLNAKINHLHHRALRIVYRDYVSSFEELLKVDCSCSIHHRNIKFLAIELYKVRNNLSPEFMSDIFLTSNNNIDNVSCNTRNHSEFYYESNPKTETYGISSLSYFGPKVWRMLPGDIQTSSTLDIFRSKIDKWKVTNCPCRLCKEYITNLGFI